MAFFKGEVGDRIREQVGFIQAKKRSNLVTRFKFGDPRALQGSLGFGFLGKTIRKLLGLGGPPPSITEEDEATKLKRSSEAERTKERRRRTRRVFSAPGGSQVAQGQGGRARLLGA